MYRVEFKGYEMIKGSHHLEESKRRGNKNPMYGIHRFGEKAPMYGKHHSKETKKKMSESHKDQVAWNKGIPMSEETKSKMIGMLRSKETKIKQSKTMKGKYIGKNACNWKGGKVKISCKNCGKEKYIRPAEIKKGNGKFCSCRCTGIWTKKHSKKKDTSIEIAIEQELIKRSIPYIKQVSVEGIALVDFLLPNKIIIQADGNYWHSRGINKGKDIAQDTLLYFKGYKIYRFTETEIKKSAKKCIESVR